MAAAVGTIPSLSTYQPGALAIGTTVYLEIVDSNNATTAQSWNMTQQDFVGKAPSVMNYAVPLANDMFAYFQKATGLPVMANVGDVGGTFGNLPAAGATGTLLQKAAATNYAASWVTIASIITVSSGLVTSGNATALTVGIGTAQVLSSMIATNAIGTAQLATNIGVTGSFGVGAGLTVTGTISAVGTATFTGAFNVNGTSSFTSGAFNVNGTSNFTGSFVNNGAFGVIGTSTLTGVVAVLGTTIMTGAVNIVGTSLITGNLGLVGTSLITGTFQVIGTATFSGGAMSFTGGTLSVAAGTATFTSAFNIIGTTMVTGLFGQTGTSNMTGVFNVVGSATFTSGAFSVIGTTLFTSGTFGVVGTSLLTGLVGILGTTAFTGVHGVVGTSLFTSGTFGVVGTSLFTSGAFGVVGTATFTSTFGIVGTSLQTGVMNVVGTASITGALLLGTLGAGVLNASSTGVVSSQGGMVLLNTLLPNNVASTNDTTSFTSTYKTYMITFENVCPATQTTGLQMQVATSGSNWISGSYISQVGTIISGTLGADSSTTVFLVSGVTAARSLQTTLAYGATGFIKLFNPASVVSRKQIVGELSYLSPGAAGTATIALAFPGGWYDGAVNPVTGVNFSFSSGNIQTGTLKIYGIT